ncbi:MAG: zinc ribbon domain-containing protein [Acidobacteria bacterium]|nr:zinc ribbon domain-containing protein [Acidobacteriota bacterium]
MPLYEYQCDACGHRFEVIQKFSDAPIEVCPKCGGSVQKLLSSPAIQFKGSGWYITDYARSGSSEASKAAPGKTDSSSSSGSESGTKADATPAKTDTAASTTPSTSAKD